MIKQFNFYDVYGYLLPGIALVGLMWVPIGLISKSWPDQDISKALFLVLLAYFLGHILQTIATNAVPSKVMRDQEDRPRFPSERLLDASVTTLSSDFKTRLAEQVQEKFKLDLHIQEDGDGTGNVFSDRNTAFFQARGYLIAKKTAHLRRTIRGPIRDDARFSLRIARGKLLHVGVGLSISSQFDISPSDNGRIWDPGYRSRPHQRPDRTFSRFEENDPSSDRFGCLAAGCLLGWRILGRRRAASPILERRNASHRVASLARSLSHAHCCGALLLILSLVCDPVRTVRVAGFLSAPNRPGIKH
ncbi:MAG TPA: hypothetical protein VKX41_15810 [Alloacidobacterium sp.]|nr:hypothetical protein [Alloacidobacterium sp.]